MKLEIKLNNSLIKMLLNLELLALKKIDENG